MKYRQSNEASGANDAPAGNSCADSLRARSGIKTGGTRLF
jgi:hypothetical protein